MSELVNELAVINSILRDSFVCQVDCQALSVESANARIEVVLTYP